MPCGPGSAGPGPTCATPSASAIAADTASTSPPAGTITSVAALAPAGKERARSSCPSSDSTSSRNASACVNPVSIVSTPSAQTTSTAVVPIQIRRGPRATRSPTRRHAPCVSSAPSSPKCGMPLSQPKMAGRQNARRPQMTSSAGSSVSMESIATAMPSAPIGPRPAVPCTRATVRQSSAQITVSPEAKIAGPAVRRASCIASCLSSCLRSSSR